MRQVHIPHTAGRFAVCRQAGHEPKHYTHYGRSIRETMQMTVPAVRHSLECACGRSTGLHESLQVAEADWGVLYGQIPMALSAPTPITCATNRRRQSRGRSDDRS